LDFDCAFVRGYQKDVGRSRHGPTIEVQSGGRQARSKNGGASKPAVLLLHDDSDNPKDHANKDSDSAYGSPRCGSRSLSINITVPAMTSRQETPIGRAIATTFALLVLGVGIGIVLFLALWDDGSTLTWAIVRAGRWLRVRFRNLAG